MSAHQLPLPFPGSCPARRKDGRCTRDRGHAGVHWNGRWHWFTRAMRARLARLR